MHRNARTTVRTEPLWALFGTAALFYLPLFMKDAGLSTIEIGVIVSINLYLAAVIQLAAGVITDRFGRKRATLLFDMTSWVIPMAIWALSGNFWWFLVGYVLNATSKVVGVSFWLLATEDSPEAHRPRIFAAIKIIILLAGLLVPLVGVFAERYGEIPTFRVLFVLGSIAMLAHNLIRNALCEETTAGEQAMHRSRSTPVREQLVESTRIFRAALRHPTLWRVTAFYLATSIAYQLNIFLSIYLARHLDLSAVATAMAPAIAAAAALFCYLGAMPYAERRVAVPRLAMASAALAAIGWLVFLAVPPQGIGLLIASVATFSAGAFCLESYRDAMVVSCVHPDERASLFAAVQSLTAVVSIPAGFVSAVLFDMSPRALFFAIALLYAAAFCCALGRHFAANVIERVVIPRQNPTNVPVPIP